MATDKKHVLITGCLGHIGSYLIRDQDFLNTHTVVGIDNLATQRYCSLFDYPDNFYFMEKPFQDLTTEEIEAFDVVIHLAAITDAAASFQNKALVNAVNVDDTVEFFDKVSNTERGTHIIFPSSTSVYGSNQRLVNEDTDPNPQSPYAESKVLVEDDLRAIAPFFTILRLGTIFGTSPGMRFHTAINRFCWQAAMEQPLTIWEQNYRQFRPYLGLLDAVTAIRLAILRGGEANETYNVLTNNYTVEQIVKMIIGYSRFPLELRFVDTPLLNQFDYQVCGKKFERATGFVPQDSLARAIERTLKLFSANYAGEQDA